MRLPVLLMLTLPMPAMAGLPGEEAPVISIDARATSASDMRSPLSGGLGFGAAIPLDQRAAIPDLEIRADLQLNRLPPQEVEDFIRDNPVGPDVVMPDRLTYTRLQSRVSAMASWGATSRETGLRLRLGPELLIEGDSGAVARLEPAGWTPDYTATSRLGLHGAFGLALPFGDEIGDPLLDLRLGASVLGPILVSGGGVSDPEYQEFALTVDDQEFQPVGLLGRETRAWGEATLTVEHLRVGLALGFQHRARSPVQRARAESPTWDVLDQPEAVDPLAQVTVGVVF